MDNKEKELDLKMKELAVKSMEIEIAHKEADLEEKKYKNQKNKLPNIHELKVVKFSRDSNGKPVLVLNVVGETFMLKPTIVVTRTRDLSTPYMATLVDDTYVTMDVHKIVNDDEKTIPEIHHGLPNTEFRADVLVNLYNCKILLFNMAMTTLVHFIRFINQKNDDCVILGTISTEDEHNVFHFAGNVRKWLGKHMKISNTGGL